MLAVSCLGSLAKARIPRAQLLVADLNDGMPLAAGSQFDIVVASLLIHYLKDPTIFLRSAYRVLRPHGQIIISTHHPLADLIRLEVENYFKTQLVRGLLVAVRSQFNSITVPLVPPCPCFELSDFNSKHYGNRCLMAVPGS